MGFSRNSPQQAHLNFAPILGKTNSWEYRSSKWHYRQRKIIFELIMHFVADTDAAENYFGVNFW